MIETILFTTGSLILIWISFPSLKHPGSHGWYRFFAWTAIWGLFLLNLRTWFIDPLSSHQVISWFLLCLSLVPLIWGVFLLRRVGKPEDALEATTRVVDRGIYRLIRHPMYASLLLLAWGIFLKSPSVLDACLAVVASAYLYATAKADEAECLQKFGDDYARYMRTTKRFIPFLF